MHHHHWSSLFQVMWLIVIGVSDSSSHPRFLESDSALDPDWAQESDSASPQDSAPEPVLAPANDSLLRDYDLSESEVASEPDLALPVDAPNGSLDYNLEESESAPEPELNLDVHGPLEDLYIKYYGSE